MLAKFQTHDYINDIIKWLYLIYLTPYNTVKNIIKHFSSTYTFRPKLGSRIAHTFNKMFSRLMYK